MRTHILYRNFRVKIEFSFRFFPDPVYTVLFYIRTTVVPRSVDHQPCSDVIWISVTRVISFHSEPTKKKEFSKGKFKKKSRRIEQGFPVKCENCFLCCKKEIFVFKSNLTNSSIMSSSVAKTSKYTYRSTGGGNADVSIEYSADLSALSRLEVSLIPTTSIKSMLKLMPKGKKTGLQCVNNTKP